MRHFLKIGDVEVAPVVEALARAPHLWDQHRLRTEHPGTAHAQVSDIWLWFNDIDPAALADVADDREVVPYPAWSALPQVRQIVFQLMHRVCGVRLGRVLITRLAPGGRIAPHVDGGAPATYFDRYQIALQSLPGVVFRAGDEQVNFASGEVWMFDNTQEHEVINNSADDRLALIVDIRSA